ncbi:unnamed protein product [Phytophthora fragariaefolia]|uniref:RNA-directed DNA polymerase n=1 Tax=Phytophthora fragariaefolia TaxID=1490495 RepID=A0A9W6XP34_9STRA|nr:unnamed protein product [Phytophthora fragariaefolia]
MVRVAGSLDDSGFHRETPQEDTQSEFGQGNEASTNIGSPTTPLNQDRSTERQSPLGGPAGLDENLDPPDESPPAQAGANTSVQPQNGRSTAKKKTAKSKPSRKKIKAPDSETEDRGDLMSDDQLTKAYYKKELHTFLINDTVMRVLRPKILGELQGPVLPPAAGSNKLSATKALMCLLEETGIIDESSKAETLFDLKLSEIKQSVQSLNKVIDNTCDIEKESATALANLHQTDEYSRSEVKMILDISLGESRGYWKYHEPDKKFKQAKAVGKINNAKATLLFDSGAELSIIDTAFARKVGCYVDNSQTLQCDGVGKFPYTAEGRTHLKITLAGSLVYFFDAWVGPPTGGQDLILGMDCMAPAGIRPDFADGTICLPDEVRIQLAGRRPLYGDKVEQVTMGGYYEIDTGRSEEVRVRTGPTDRQKLWVTRGDRWVPTYVAGAGRSVYLRLTNVSERKLILHGDTKIAMWLTRDRVPRLPGYVLVGSRRYVEWQNLAYQASTDENGVTPKQEEVQGPAVERPLYPTPTSILKRPPTCPLGTAAAGQIKGRDHDIDSLCNVQGLQLRSAEAQVATSRAHDATNKAGICSAHVIQNQGRGASDLDQRLNTSANQWRDQRRVGERSTNPDGLGDFSGEHKHIPADDAPNTHSAPVDLEDRAVDPGDEEQVDRLKHIIWRRRHLLIGKGNALPPAAKGAICDIDVGNAKPVAQRVRKVAPQFHKKLLQLIKGLLSAKIIQHSTSPWVSPIVVIIKKNGIDIRLCIDYGLVNSLTRLMVYPMPLINDLLDDLDKVLWYCSLDMASGFWVVSMADRARAISAFITPFGLFEWKCMPFGLKNAPQIYQRLLYNALYGFLKITKRQDHQARNAGDQGQQRPIDLFRDGEPDTDKESCVLGRRAYIDDILVTAESWDMLCERVDTLLDACDEWNLSISVAKTFWGLKKVDYLGHRISAGGMEARPKDLSSLADLPFPTTLRSMQSFLGSLNYYSRFIEDFTIYASILYELQEIDFFEASGQAKPRLESNDQDQRDKWTRANKAFVVLKSKIVNAPFLTHFDPDKRPVVILYASKWAISAALVKEHDGVYKPVKFTSRTLKPNQINYGIVDKEVLALLRMLDVCYTQLVTRSIKVLTRPSTLAWMLNSSGLQGRLGRWAALLSNWTLEIVKCTKGEDEILGVIAASITPRENVDSILTSIAPRKQPRQIISIPPPTVESDEELLVVIFDGSARVKRGGGAFSAIVWSLPDWTVISGASEYKANLTVNEAEYHGLLLCFDLLAKQHVDHNRLVICGDSNLVIRPMRGEIECKAPSLKLLRADKFASAALQREAGEQVTFQIDIDDLTTLNRVAELLVPQSQISVVKIATTTRSRQRRGWEVLQEPLVSAQQYVDQFVDCETGKGRPAMEGESPGNLQATYPLQIIAMDHIPSLPKS